MVTKVDGNIVEGIFLPYGRYISGITEVPHIYHKDGISCFNEFKKDVDEGKLFGEIDHVDLNMDINLAHISHKIIDTELTKDGIYGKVELLNTPNGIHIKNLLKSNILLFFVPRMMVMNDNQNFDVCSIFTIDFSYENFFIRNKRRRLSEEL